MTDCSHVPAPEKLDASHYSLTKIATKDQPTSLVELDYWLTQGKAQSRWDGKLYVASTIEWNSVTNEFRQSGCSPNYQCGIWTLACCKHDMRSGEQFQGNAIDLAVPTYVFTLSRKNTEIGQSLVSVARITAGFKTMNEYADFLRVQRPKVRSSRFTRTHIDDGLLGWRFGDCHANDNGDVGSPTCGHVHSQSDWQRDCNGKHMILVSTDYLLWERPAFVARNTEHQSRFGRNMDGAVLREFLQPI